MGIVPPQRPVIPANWQDSPENVGRLPREIIGDFSALKSSGGSYRLRTSGVLPHGLPGNFNNITSELEIPYGSVGFKLICRSAKDFTEIIAIIYDFMAMNYTQELSGPGAGSVTLDMDSPFLTDQLVNGNDIETLLARDNLWEVYFDGKRVFQWLAQHVKEDFIGSNEERGIAISGAGIAQTLDWASVLPNRFPTPKEKIDSVRDSFTDQDVDLYGKWSDNAGTVSAAGRRLNIRVTASGGLGSYVSTPVNYDFVDSGAQAFVQPYLAPNGPGYLKTLLSIEESTTSYVQIYVTRDPVDVNGNVLVAEVAGPGGTQAVRIGYNPSTQNYWRIQEMDGNAIFSYRSSNSTEADWVTFATLPYSFNPTSVRLRLRAVAVGGANLTLPQSSFFSEVSTDGVASPLAPLERFRRLILRAQARGTIRHIIPNWSATADSMGAEWVSDASVDVQIGADLLAVLTDYCNAIQADWFVDADYRLHIRQRVWSESGDDPTAPFHKEDKVIFYEAESQNSKNRSRSFSNVRNYVVGRTENDEYTVQSDLTSVGNFQQREAFVSDTLSTRDIPSLQEVLRNHLASTKDGTISWDLQVPFGIEGKQLYKDYSLGDWISVQTTFPHRMDVWRIVAVSVSVGNDGDPQVELMLNDKLTPYWYKLKDDVKRARWQNRFSVRGATRFTP